MKIQFVLLALFAAACTEKNPNLCCTDAASCAADGLTTDAMCSGGLICRGNQCVAEPCTTSDQCEGGAPFCSSGGLCSMMCSSDAECPGFGGAPSDIYCATGQCLECRTSADCDATRPICDAGSCRTCELDSECDSLACSDTGTCVSADAVMYVSPTGVDAGTCPQDAPCATISFAINQASTMKSQIVLASGTYTERAYVDSSVVSASTLTIYGGGATWKLPNGGDSSLIDLFGVGLHLKNVNLVGNTSASALLQAGTVPSTVEHVTFSSAATGVAIASGALTIHDCQFVNVNFGITVGGALTLDRVTMRGGVSPLKDVGTTPADFHVDISNLITFDDSNGIDLQHSAGTIRFSTLGDTTTGGMALKCGSALSVDSSIVWNPSGMTITGSCALHSTIVGPAVFGTAMNADPLFVDELQRNYHLTASSPAKDLVDSGPTTDIDGDARPQGLAFDIGADEVK